MNTPTKHNRYPVAGVMGIVLLLAGVLMGILGLFILFLTTNARSSAEFWQGLIMGAAFLTAAIAMAFARELLVMTRDTAVASQRAAGLLAAIAEKLNAPPRIEIEDESTAPATRPAQPPALAADPLPDRMPPAAPTRPAPQTTPAPNHARTRQAAPAPIAAGPVNLVCRACGARMRAIERSKLPPTVPCLKCKAPIAVGTG